MGGQPPRHGAATTGTIGCSVEQHTGLRTRIQGCGLARRVGGPTGCAPADVQVPCRQQEQQARAVVPRLERAVHVADQRVRVRLALRELVEQRAAWWQARARRQRRQRSQQDVSVAPS